MRRSKAKHQRKRTTLEDVLRILRTQLPELRERYGVGTLGIFGSYMRGEQTRRSDVDLLVDFDRSPTLPEFIDLEHHLSKLLGVKVDLVTRRALKGEIGQRILSGAISV
jgi:uncharacterized protein